MEIPPHRAKYAGFEGLVLGLEDGIGLSDRQFLVGKGQVLRDQAAHFFLELLDFFVGDAAGAELTVQAAGKRMVDFEDFVREECAHRLQRVWRTDFSFVQVFQTV